MTRMEKYHIQHGRLVKVPPPFLKEFGDGDCYLVDTTASTYLWVGKKATPDEKLIGTLTSKIPGRSGSISHLITIEQGEEPKEFLELFGGDIIITDFDTEGILQRVSLKQRDFKLFRVHIDRKSNLFFEVPRKKSSLTSDDVFLLDTFSRIFIWQGKDSTEMERRTAKEIAQRYDAERAGIQEIVSIPEGKETKEFLKALK
jgi:villin 1